MDGVSAGIDRASDFSLRLARLGAAAVMLGIGAQAGGAPPSSIAGSLCTMNETPIFSCPIGAKRVSVCGAGPGKATYRFGTRSRLEIQSKSLTRADRGFSGGGESQIIATNKGYRYIVYSGIYRTAFGADGRHAPESRAALIVRRGDKTVMTTQCSGDATMRVDPARYMPEGQFVEH